MKRPVALAVVLLLAAGVAAHGQSAREIVERGKAATALVEYDGGKKSASATCIHERGIFVTNRHVVNNISKDGVLKLTLRPNESDQKAITAKVLRSDGTWDLAVLQAVEAGTYPFLALGDDRELIETMSVTAFGFPFGKDLAVKGSELPDISVNVGRITALRKRDGRLQQVQLDAQVNPGNSGGPVIDDKGRVVGIVQSGVFATGVNFAVPVSAVRDLLQQPDVQFQTPTLTVANRHDEQEFVVKVVPFLEELKDVAVELELSVSGTEPRKFVAEAAPDHTYRIRAIPLPKAEQPAAVRLNAKIAYTGGSVTGQIEDCELTIGGETIRLADVRSLRESAGQILVTRHSGGSKVESVAGLEEVKVDFGGYSLTMNLQRAKQIDLAPIRNDSPSVGYTLVVRSATGELHRRTGTLSGGGSAAGASAVAFTPYRGERQVLSLPDLVHDVALARGGRLLLLYLKKSRKIAVYDVNEAKITKYISVGSDDILMAAGLEKLILVSPGSNLIERWSLESFERETTRTLSAGIVQNIALGYASTGPLLVRGSTGENAFGRSAFAFYNLDTLQPGEYDSVQLRAGMSQTDVIHVRASGTGDVFGLWSTSHSPQGMECLILDGKSSRASHQHDSAGHIAPNFDGSAILTGFAGVCTPQMQRKGARGDQIPTVPSTHPRFYLTVPADPAAQRNLGSNPFPGRKPTIRLIDSELDLATLPSLDLGSADRLDNGWSRGAITLDKRVHYIQQADQLLTIPSTNDQLIVQPFNLKDALEKSGVDYLFVSSTPPTWFERGKPLRYQIDAEANRGGVEMELANGPEGMSLTPTGELTWDVPADFAPADIQVIVNVKSGDGQTTHHAFKVKSRPAR